MALLGRADILRLHSQDAGETRCKLQTPFAESWRCNQYAGLVPVRLAIRNVQRLRIVRENDLRHGYAISGKKLSMRFPS